MPAAKSSYLLPLGVPVPEYTNDKGAAPFVTVTSAEASLPGEQLSRVRVISREIGNGGGIVSNSVFSHGGFELSVIVIETVPALKLLFVGPVVPSLQRKEYGATPPVPSIVRLAVSPKHLGPDCDITFIPIFAPERILVEAIN